MTLRLGSLFSGYGGLEMGIGQVLDVATVWHCEIEVAPSKVLSAHWPVVPNLGDITAVDWAQVKPVDVLCGGFPCQDVSAAGKRAGLKPGTRSGLWSHFRYAISQLRPSLVVIENVRGLLSAEAHSDVEPCPWCLGDPEQRGPALRALGAVLGDLAELGYDAVWVGLPASDVGAAHPRFRVIVLAWPAADTDGATRGEWRLAAPRQAEGGRAWADARGRGGAPAGGLIPTPTAADADRTSDTYSRGNPTLIGSLLPTPIATDGGGGTKRLRAGGRTEADHGPSLRDLAPILLPTPVATDANGARNETSGRADGSAHHSGTTLGDVAHTGRWGQYAAAICRWESVLGRPAPDPTEPSRSGGQRLSPQFVEWLMGLPSGWVTDVVTNPKSSRNDHLRMLGNGVVPQQATAAIAFLLTVIPPSAWSVPAA